MKKILITLIGLLCATTLVVNAQDANPTKHQQLAAERKALKKEMLEKYDTNKNGKLDKAEKAKISKEDRERMEKAGLLKIDDKKASDRQKLAKDSAENISVMRKFLAENNYSDLLRP